MNSEKRSRGIAVVLLAMKRRSGRGLKEVKSISYRLPNTELVFGIPYRSWMPSEEVTRQRLPYLLKAWLATRLRVEGGCDGKDGGQERPVSVPPELEGRCEVWDALH